MRTALAVLAASLFVPALWAQHHEAGVPADEALQRLKDGNARYVAGHLSHPDESTDRRTELTQGQHPFAVIVGCSDSRVPPEIIFDQGLGDLFVIRAAGNVVDSIGIGSVEYAVEHLGVHLVIVLGHEKCGAVTAAVKATREAHITSIVKAIEPAVAQVKGKPGDEVHNCVAANARRVAWILRNAQPLLAAKAAKGEVKVLAADYDLSTGAVELLP